MDANQVECNQRQGGSGFPICVRCDMAIVNPAALFIDSTTGKRMHEGCYMEGKVKPQFLIRRLNMNVEGVASTILIADGESKGILGYVELRWMGPHCASFRSLFVVQEYRRQGIGKALVEECCRIAKADWKAGSITMGVQNTDSLINFYQRSGFYVAYQYEDGSLLMSKPLKGYMNLGVADSAPK